MQAHLTFPPPVQGVQLFSGLTAKLRDARRVSGREVDTGRKIAGQHHGSWLGAIGYLVLLDQIGKCFKPKGVPLYEGNPLERALIHFGKLAPNDACALYALRCALLHEYGLNNVPARDNQCAKYLHAFILVCHQDAPLVGMPKSRWDGRYENNVAEQSNSGQFGSAWRCG